MVSFPTVSCIQYGRTLRPPNVKHVSAMSRGNMSFKYVRHLSNPFANRVLAHTFIVLAFFSPQCNWRLRFSVSLSLQSGDTESRSPFPEQISGFKDLVSAFSSRLRTSCLTLLHVRFALPRNNLIQLPKGPGRFSIWVYPTLLLQSLPTTTIAPKPRALCLLNATFVIRRFADFNGAR